MGASNPQKVRHIAGPKPLAYVANGQDTQTIPGGFLLREMVLRLNYTLTTSSALAAAAILPGAEWGVVALIQILAGTEVIKEYTGEELRIMSAIKYHQWPRPRLALGATSTPVNSVVTLPFWDTLARKPIDCALNTSAYGNLRIVVKWADATKIASTGTVFTVAPSIDWTMETSTGYKGQLFETRTARQIATTVPQQTDYPIVLTTGLVAIRSLLIYAKDSSNLDDPNLITTVKLKSLNTLLIEGTFAGLRDNAWQRLELRDQVSAGAALSPMQEPSFNMDNWLFIDFAKDGYLSEAFPTFRINDLRVLLTTTGAIPTIVAVAEYIIPPPPK